jgi:hypothetical protein
MEGDFETTSATASSELKTVEEGMPVVDATVYVKEVCSASEVIETCAEANAEAAIRKWLPGGDFPATTPQMQPAMCSLVCT